MLSAVSGSVGLRLGLGWRLRAQDHWQFRHCLAVLGERPFSRPACSPHPAYLNKTPQLHSTPLSAQTPRLPELQEQLKSLSVSRFLPVGSAWGAWRVRMEGPQPNPPQSLPPWPPELAQAHFPEGGKAGTLRELGSLLLHKVRLLISLI